MTTEEKAALVAFIEGRLNQHATILPLEVYNRFQEEVYRIALAALTTEPVAAVLPDDIFWLKNGGKAEASSHYIRMEGSLKLFAAHTP